MSYSKTQFSSSGPSEFDKLLTPTSVGSLQIPNRFAMAPMTREFSPDGVPGPDVADYYRKRAAGGVGLLITEGGYIPHPAVGPSTRVPHLYGDAAADGWREVIDAVHGEGSVIFPQLWHLGIARGRSPLLNPSVASVSPAGLGLDGEPVGRALDADDLNMLVDSYVQAAVFAKEVGFDGLELHGAHGYLLDQFLWRVTNQRGDDFGDPVAFPAHVVEAVREAVGADFPIVFRFSQWKTTDFEARIADTPEELETLLGALVAAGVDAFHPSTRRFWEPAFTDRDSERSLAGWTRKLSGRPTIVVGSIGLDSSFISANDTGGKATAGATGLDELLKRFDREEFDLIAIGRALLSDPEWVNKHRVGLLPESYDPKYRDELI